jgi:hypothetical protein
MHIRQINDRQKCNITFFPECVSKDLRIIERTENKFFYVLFAFLFKKFIVFLGVNSDLTVQKTVKNFYIFKFSDTVLSNIYQIKKKQNFLSFPWPEIFGRKGARFFDVRVILTAPTVCMVYF